MRNPGHNIRDHNGQSDCCAGPTMTLLCTRNPLLSNTGVNPWKSTVQRSPCVQSLGSERFAQSPSRCYNAGGTRRQHHGKATQLPHVFRLRHRQSHRPAPQVLHRRRGALCCPLPAGTRAPGLSRPPARGDHQYTTGHANNAVNLGCVVVSRNST
jgi:hypothetical protein